MPGPNTSRGAAMLAWSLLAIACGDPAPPASRFCPEGCNEGLRCYAPTEECVAEGVVSCDPACASYEQCSARAPEATCFAQVCSLPPAPPTPLLKVVSLSILSDAEACDVDGDGTGDGELDALVGAYAELPQALADAIAADRITVFVARDAERVDLLFGTLDPGSLRCDPSSPTAGCRYTITRESYDRGARSGPCPAWLSLPDARLVEGALSAGGEGINTGISVPIEAQQFLLQAYGVRIDGTLREEGGRTTGGTLRICGALPERELLAALEGLPADTLEPVGGLDGARSLLAAILRADIDADGDGSRDSVSFALGAELVTADTTGWSP
jgi:hypothetical protein